MEIVITMRFLTGTFLLVGGYLFIFIQYPLSLPFPKWLPKSYQANLPLCLSLFVSTVVFPRKTNKLISAFLALYN